MIYMPIYLPATRKLHLEVVFDLTKRSFLQAFRLFRMRKSLPYHMLSDNAPTYLTAYLEIEDEVTDPTFGDDFDLKQRANKQALILQQFWYRWKHEYLTSLREFHKNTGSNKQSIRNEDVVLVHDETRRTAWKFAIVESLIKGQLLTQYCCIASWNSWLSV